MQKKYFKFLFIILIIAFVVPQITLAAWWNPMSWGIWNKVFKKQTTSQQNNSKVPLTTGTLMNVTLTYPNPYDVSKNDTINLSGGKALIYDSGKTKPRAYNVAKTAVGDLNGDGMAEGVIGVYQGYGANIIVPIVFVVSKKDSALTQIDSVVPDASGYNGRTQIKSFSVDNGVLSVNLLILAEKDKLLPRYQQQATVAKTIQYKLVDGKLVLQPSSKDSKIKK